MINKIIQIANLGKFKDFSAVGDVAFSRLTLVYADNGTGKTTLTSAVRSLEQGNPKIIIGRKTLGSDGEISARLLINNTPVDFKKNIWAECSQKFEIFDFQFIVDNIFSGNSVAHDHKRNLHKLVIGEEGVTLALSIEKIDGQVRGINSQAGQLEREITKSIVGALTLQEFIALTEQNDVGPLIKALDLEIQSLKKSDSIKTAALPSPLTKLGFDFERLKGLLKTTFASLGEEAEKRIQAHLAEHKITNLNWIEAGLNLNPIHNCPFCGQGTSATELIGLYKTYFDSGYKAFRGQLDTLLRQHSSEEASRVGERLSGTFKNNQAIVQFWKDHIDVGANPISDIDVLIHKAKTVFAKVTTLLTKKQAARDVVIDDGDLDTDCAPTIRQINDQIDRYNLWINQVTQNASKKRSQMQPGLLAQKEKELINLKNKPVRFSDSVNSKCKELAEIAEKKKLLEREKVEQRKKLEQYAEGVFSQYEEKINQFLKDFGATFTIADKKENFAGGKPSTNYRLCINGTKFELGDHTVDESVPSFKNTLSEGEKSTLAFCYFLARLNADKNLADKCIIIDDPLSSFDSFRREKTKQAIITLAKRAKQVIVMSHDRYFLRLIWDGSKDLNGKCLNLYRKGDGTSLGEWDIERETRSKYLQDYFALVSYLENGVPNGNESELRAVARCIRPVLEHNLHLRFPGEFKENEWLGDYISRIRDSDEKNDSIGVLKAQLSAIESINDFSKRFHHRDNPNCEHEPITDAELSTFVKQTLQVGSGILTAGFEG